MTAQAGVFTRREAVRDEGLGRLARELGEAGLLERRREGRRLLLEPGPQARFLSGA